jgi:tetratricopeptide (TPR) repeat protein
MKTTMTFLFTFISFLLLSQNKTDYATNAFNARLDGKWNKAESILKHAVEVDSADATCYFELARIGYWTEGEGLSKFTEAYTKMTPRIKANKKNIKKAIRLDKNNARYYYYAGLIESHYFMTRVYTPTGWWDTRSSLKRTTRYMENAVILDPDMVDAKVFLANMYNIGKLRFGSKKKLNNLLEDLKNRNVAAYVDALNVIDEENRIEIIDSLLKVYPDDPQLLANAAFVIQRVKGRKKEANKLWSKSLENDPKNVWALSKYVFSCNSADTVTTAIPAIENFIKATSNECNLLQSAGYKAYLRVCSLQNDDDCMKENKKKAEALDEILMGINSKPEWDWLMHPGK